MLYHKFLSQNTLVISLLKTITKNQKYNKRKKYVLNFMKRVIQIV